MNLIIHDLNAAEWNKISENYSGWNVISDNGSIRSCIGCFSCWNKNPGQCAVKDGYENMGSLIHNAGEVVVISKYTYGGFSGFVKNVFDRSLGYVLPQFEVIDGETHHQKRYDEDKPFTFIFYGQDLTEKEKNCARRYVKAVCTNIRGHVKEVIFKQTAVSDAEKALPGGAPRALPSDTPKASADNTEKAAPIGKTVLLNGSMRNLKGNSAKLARTLKEMLATESEIVDLKDFMSDKAGLVRLLEGAETIVLCMPLYVDGLPSQVIRLMEAFEAEYQRGTQQRGTKKIYVLTNMGLYESKQLVNLFSAVRQWCRKMGFQYCGGLGVSAGELLGVLMEYIPLRIGPTRNLNAGMKKLASAIDSGAAMKNLYAEPYLFPRALYIQIANTNWNRSARKNGIKPEDLYRCL